MIMTDQVQPHRHRHHRRSPAKRFLLATGPFFFLTGAVLLSAGVIELVEQVPTGKSQPTLAEERASGALEAGVTPPASIASVRMQSLPGELLEGSDYDLSKRPVEPISRRRAPRRLGVARDNFGFEISERSDVGAGDALLGLRARSRDFEPR
jgi:hypothetical protein